MKLFFLTLLTAVLFGSVLSVNAQTDQSLSVRVGRQKKESRSKLTIKFVSVLEDSRCPEGTTCVWAGNARIKVVIHAGSEVKTAEMNTNVGVKGGTFDSYAVYLTDLSTPPKSKSKRAAGNYTATFSIVKLSR